MGLLPVKTAEVLLSYTGSDSQHLHPQYKFRRDCLRQRFSAAFSVSVMQMRSGMRSGYS